MSRIIVHIDLNQFFVRCEEIKDPSLIGKPVAVGGDGRRGIVSTCSYEARKYGVHSGMPMFQAKMICKNLIIKDVDYKYYELMSKEFISYVRKFARNLEQMSIDECFCDFTDLFKKYSNDFPSFLRRFQNGLFKRTQLKCSIGVAPTKFLAKMGSEYKKPMGITIIRKKDIPNIIFPLPIKDYFGIGKKTYPILEREGIKTIGDLYEAIKNDDDKIANFFGKFKDEIIKELEGNSSDHIDSESANPKSIGMTRTLAFDSNDELYIRNFFEHLVYSVIKSFNEENKLCKTIQITYKDANSELNFKVSTVSKSFKEYTNSEEMIHEAAMKLFDESYNGQNIRLIGFTIKNLTDKHDVNVQMTFDNFEMHERENKTQMLINKLNREANKKVFMRLSDLKDKKYED